MNLQALFFACYALIACTVISIVFITQLIPGQAQLLRSMTIESGPFELGTVFILLIISLRSWQFLLFTTLSPRTGLNYHKLFILAFSLVALLAALEELSWGQHLFQFDAEGVFAEHNKQQETNLHNFIAPELFGLAVNIAFYVLFVFIPLFAKLAPQGFIARSLQKLGLIEFLPHIHLILIFCFGFALQAYFKIETISDTLALVASLVLAGYIIFVQKKETAPYLQAHFILLIMATVFFMLCYRIFAYENMQYEIREFIFIFALLACYQHYLATLIQRRPPEK